jgi:hypothetical protein
MRARLTVTYHEDLGDLDLDAEVLEWIGVKIIELQEFPNLASVEHTEWLIRVRWDGPGQIMVEAA